MATPLRHAWQYDEQREITMLRTPFAQRLAAFALVYCLTAAINVPGAPWCRRRFATVCRGRIRKNSVVAATSA
ncbi:MAG TPA: hypothetical protein VGX78_20725 [Pirellulales bacterium]|nr:hypothetical protein [Pirellulales bacterium]